MGAGKTLTLETAKKVWTLHEKGIDPQLIAFTVGTSISSVNRVIKVVEATKNREDLDALFGVGVLQNIRKFALDILGIPVEVTPVEPPVQKTADEYNTATFMVKVLEALEKQNALLERLCNEWGCSK